MKVSPHLSSNSLVIALRCQVALCAIVIINKNSADEVSRRPWCVEMNCGTMKAERQQKNVKK